MVHKKKIRQEKGLLVVFLDIKDTLKNLSLMMNRLTRLKMKRKMKNAPPATRVKIMTIFKTQILNCALNLKLNDQITNPRADHSTHFAHTHVRLLS